MTPSQIAFKAADYMAEHGHCKGTLQDAEGRVCLEGAVRMAVWGEVRLNQGSWSLFDDSPANKLWTYLYFLIQQDHPDSGHVTFNDDITTSSEDVILLLKRAGRELEELER